MEFAHLENAGGVDGDETQYATAGISLGYDNWTVSTTYQDRSTETGGTDVDDYVYDFTVGYAFDFGLEVAAAYRAAEEDNCRQPRPWRSGWIYHRILKIRLIHTKKPAHCRLF